MSQLWQHPLIYGSDEDDVFETHYLATSLPDITLLDTRTDIDHEVWTKRKRSVSESDLIDTRLYSFTQRSILI